jgi:hypothetical protein
MRASRNPFGLRRAENIETDDAFLTMFEPDLLAIISQDSLWETVHIIRSAAGGGKTSLIRVFTPNSLNALLRRGKSDEKTRELYQKMKDVGALDDDGPCALGVILSCGPGYSMLEDLNIEQGRKDRLFFGLLNARIVLAVLRGAVELKSLDITTGLKQISIATAAHAPSLQGITFPCTGDVLYRWAEHRESMLCDSLDSLGPLDDKKLPGDDSLYSLTLMAPGNIATNGVPIGRQVLLMMDDVHKLTSHQREVLVRTVIDARSPIGVWIAERFEALSALEMLSSGAVQGRDLGATLEIENFWRSRPDRFEKLATRVADRRIYEAPETNIDSFRSCLQESFNGPEWDQRFDTIAATVGDRIREKYGDKERFRTWIAECDRSQGTPQQRATAWRGLEVLIERELNKKQRGLFDQHPLSEEEFSKKNDSSINQAAELFLAREFRLPYYYGSERIARLASLNIQQFLGLGGPIFEEASAAEVMRKLLSLTPQRQHEIMKKMAKQLWDNIPNNVRHGRVLRQFLESVGNFSHWYTYRPTAPNDPGVTGTAIRMSERAQILRDSANPSSLNQATVRFGEILASALSHNLLVSQLDYSCKSEKWMLLYLNRLLCVHFDLPIGYGLYKEKPLKTLIQWLDRPFVEPSQEDDLL